MIKPNTKKYILLDSAGIRKRTQRKLGAESFAVYQTIKSAWESDVLVLVLDGSKDLSHQDQVIANVVQETSKGIVVVVNKMDIVDKEQKNNFEREFYKKFFFLKVLDFIWVSAEEKLNLNLIWDSIDNAIANREVMVDPVTLRKLFNYLMKHKQPVKLRTQKRAIIYDLLFEKNKPPTFKLLVKDKKAIEKNYLKFLEKVIRRQFEIQNTGLIIKMVEVSKKNILA